MTYDRNPRSMGFVQLGTRTARRVCLYRRIFRYIMVYKLPDDTVYLEADSETNNRTLL